MRPAGISYDQGFGAGGQTDMIIVKLIGMTADMNGRIMEGDRVP